MPLLNAPPIPFTASVVSPPEISIETKYVTRPRRWAEPADIAVLQGDFLRSFPVTGPSRYPVATVFHKETIR